MIVADLVKLPNGRYDYLGNSKSELYESVKNSSDPKDKIIKDLLEQIARTSEAEHRVSVLSESKL